MDYPNSKSSQPLIAHDELQFAFMLIERGIDASEAHSRNRSILWDKGLPFYTILIDKKNISHKEYSNGTRQLVSRHINEDGSITDELIEELTS